MFGARLFAVISAFTVLAMAQTAPNTTVLPLPPFATPLSHSGRWLTDAQGRAVIYKGINVAYKLPPYTPQAQGFTEEDAAMFAREGFAGVFRDLIRCLPVLTCVSCTRVDSLEVDRAQPWSLG